MRPGHAVIPATRGETPAWVVVLDVLAKVLLMLLLARVVVDPGWGNLEGKAPMTRALTYPLLAFVIPAAHLLGARSRYPWAADLLLTVPGFSDILGNRLDLYDRVVWFDDLIHLVNTGLVAAAVVLLCGLEGASLRRRLEVAIASGLSLALVWELWEYFAFVARGSESTTAYADTIGDLSLGWLGAALAGVLVSAPHRVEGWSHPTFGGIEPSEEVRRHGAQQVPRGVPLHQRVRVAPAVLAEHPDRESDQERTEGSEPEADGSLGLSTEPQGGLEHHSGDQETPERHVARVEEHRDRLGPQPGELAGQ